MDLKARIREFVKETFFYRGELSDEESLLNKGILDSTGVLEVVGFLESAFGISVSDEDIVPENLDSVRVIADYVAKKKEQKNERRSSGELVGQL